MFRNQLLANGLVDKLEVSNKNLVKVYVRGSAPSMDAEGALRSGSEGGASSSGAVKVQPGQAPSGYKYFFHIGSVDSFERKMEEAQEALGITLGEEVGRSVCRAACRRAGLLSPFDWVAWLTCEWLR